MSISDYYHDQINDPDNLAELDNQETPEKESSEIAFEKDEAKFSFNSG